MSIQLYPGICTKKKGADESTASSASKELLKSSVVNGIKLRAVGPALMSGRIGAFAVNPQKPSEYYIAVSSGGVWKTENNGITFTPLFDKQASYSIGCITMDPKNSHVLWVGTGENNAQRSVRLWRWSLQIYGWREVLEKHGTKKL